ncbi:MAG: hypothetical protein H7145_23295, partial [Akkermansiaceae bacterium]|nr:hypothetical protein [Armatimonadota bacterium]
MRYAFLKKLLPTGICLGLVATLLAYADDANDNSPTLTSDGLMTPRTRAVISGESAHILGPVETVADVTRLGEFAISPDGGAALMAAYKSRPYPGVALSQAEIEARKPLRFPEQSLIYWDVRTRTAKTLLRETSTAESTVSMGEIQWIPQTRVALVTLGRYSLSAETETLSLMRVDTVAGTVRRVVGLEMASSVEVSPSQPLVYIRIRAVKGENGQPGTSPYLQVYTPQGLGRVIRFDEGTGPLRWMLDGKSVYATRFNERSPEGKRTSRNLLTVIDLQTGEITHPEKLPTVQDNEGTPRPYAEWSVGPETTQITVPGPFGQGQDTTALWLRGRQVAAPQTRPNNAAASVSPAPVSVAFHADALLVAT